MDMKIVTVEGKKEEIDDENEEKLMIEWTKYDDNIEKFIWNERPGWTCEQDEDEAKEKEGEKEGEKKERGLLVGDVLACLILLRDTMFVEMERLLRFQETKLDEELVSIPQKTMITFIRFLCVGGVKELEWSEKVLEGEETAVNGNFHEVLKEKFGTEKFRMGKEFMELKKGWFVGSNDFAFKSEGFEWDNQNVKESNLFQLTGGRTNLLTLLFFSNPGSLIGKVEKDLKDVIPVDYVQPECNTRNINVAARIYSTEAYIGERRETASERIGMLNTLYGKGKEAIGNQDMEVCIYSPCKLGETNVHPMPLQYVYSCVNGGLPDRGECNVAARPIKKKDVELAFQQLFGENNMNMLDYVDIEDLRNMMGESNSKEGMIWMLGLMALVDHVFFRDILDHKDLFPIYNYLDALMENVFGRYGFSFVNGVSLFHS